VPLGEFTLQRRVAPGDLRVGSEPIAEGQLVTVALRARRVESGSACLDLADLERARAEAGDQQIESVRRWRVEGVGSLPEADEPGLGRLLLVGTGSAPPGSCQKQQGKAMSDIAVRVVDRVRLGL
jgi:hypothetical protein